jgi:hypothetical protein
MNLNLFDSFPIAGGYVGVSILMLVFSEVGYQFGVHSRTGHDKEAPSSLGPMVGGLLAMLAFVLAFTFSIASHQHDVRKQSVLEEANSIGTAYGLKVKHLLREYVDIRLKAANGSDIDTAVARSVEIHNHLWDLVSAAAKERPNTNTSLMIQSINDMIDMHEKRVTAGLRNRIPSSVWMALVGIIALTMITMGTQVGLTGKRRLVAMIPLVLAFAVLVTLVVDLNRPQSGLITVGQQSMVDLQRSMSR